VEQIDIGGRRIEDVLAAGGLTLDQRRGLAAEAFARTAAYDIAISGTPA
jgi:phosphoribosylaminoimidazolecarboxamide formyltransferase/IMP cyclohydrolase